MRWMMLAILVNAAVALVWPYSAAARAFQVLTGLFAAILAGFWIRQHGRSWVAFRAGQLRGLARRITAMLKEERDRA
jgi:hypothetical protein